MALIIALLGLIVLCITFYKLTEKGITVNTYDEPEWSIEQFFEADYLKQSEIQQLCSYLSVQLNNAEKLRDRQIELARKCKAQGDREGATAYYNGAGEYSKFLKKFGKIQGRLKHQVQTRG